MVDCSEDRPFWSVRRMWDGLRMWAWLSALYPEVRIPGPLAFIKYHRRPHAQCAETGYC